MFSISYSVPSHRFRNVLEIYFEIIFITDDRIDETLLPPMKLCIEQNCYKDSNFYDQLEKR